ASAYPHHPLAEPSLIMIPRKLLSNDAKPIGETNVKHAERALNLLHDRYPHSRFSAEAIGWRARLLYVQKLYDAARVIYKRQYDESSPAVRIHRPLDSLIWCDRMSGDVAAKAADFLIRWRDSNDNAERGRAALDVTASLDSFAGKDAERFWNLIRPDPNLLAAYIDFRVDVAEPGPDLLSLANKPKNWAHSSEASHIEARLSQAAYILHRYEAARRLALRVPREKAKRDDLALTEFVLASCLKHKGSYGAALSHYRHLVTHYPQSYLVGGAKENLALLYEREGRLDRALDLYRSMKYEFDVDYLIDIRMTPAELRNYVRSHTRDPQAKLLRFSLGLRYLRAKQFGLAKAQLKTLTAAQRSKLLHPKDIYYMDDGPTTRVYDPLKTATELQHLTHLCARRKGSAKAAALTQLGDYYYSHRSLLLYNPSLWEGNRAYAIGFSWNDQVAGYHDKRALDRHHWEHECVAQAYLAYKRAVEAAPHSASSFRAAYMASCSLERLAGLNPYWRWEDNREDLYGRAIRYMRIAAGSPDRALRKKAVKYKGVFIEERKQRRSEFTPYHKVGEHYSGGY
ncbi:MAG TPA: hypothetical protein VG944_04640, partial [Fimbriimonas sp.]|nr:hypothetical protein [Fimbriimonas sp.]